MVKVLAWLFYNFAAFVRVVLLRKETLAIQYETIYSFPAAFFARLLLHCHCLGDDVIIPRILRRSALFEFALASASDLIVSASKDATSGRLARTRTLHVPPGVPPHFVIRRKSISFKKIRAVFVGTLTYRANVRAVNNIVKTDYFVSRDSDCQLWVVGGPAPLKVASKSRVRFLGSLDDYSLLETYRNANVGLLPFFGISTEGPKGKLLEYMAAQLLVISSPEGVEGYPDLVAWKDYVPASSVEEMAQLLSEVRRNPERFVQIVRNGHEFALSRYQWPRLLEQYLSFMENLRSASNS